MIKLYIISDNCDYPCEYFKPGAKVYLNTEVDDGDDRKLCYALDKLELCINTGLNDRDVVHGPNSAWYLHIDCLLEIDAFKDAINVVI